MTIRYSKEEILDALFSIPIEALSYQDWVSCGMALHSYGFDLSDWQRWSATDTRRHKDGTSYYSERACSSKWEGFDAVRSDGVSVGTIVKHARDHGWSPPLSASQDRALDWDDPIEVTGESKYCNYNDDDEDHKKIDMGWIEDKLPDDGKETPATWSDARQLSDYLAVLFDDSDHVGYVCSSWMRDGRAMPTKGHWDRTAGQLRQELDKTQDVGAVLGDWDPYVGAWIRFNPLDGKGCGNGNVTEYRFALVESDTVPLAKQQGMIEAMHLPCAAIVSSGHKSIHAIVKIDAGKDYDLYRKRVDALYTYCKKHGFEVDPQNKNPSRLSRMPGVVRTGKKQMLLATHTGVDSWAAWEAWVQESEDDLPDTESLADKLKKPDPLSPPLIGTEEEGILRCGHKLLIAGPSKAGKSMILMELAIAIARGENWIGYPCLKGTVLYINLEIDSSSFVERFKKIIMEKHADEKEIGKAIDIWNLRGHATPIDKLAPRLIYRARSKKYTAIIIDPIYKIITGDENSASEMAKFCNQFDKIADSLGSAVIYCHHHSKGVQGQKRSMDRASGSGVFARDPDALLDIAPLEAPPDQARSVTGKDGEVIEYTFWRVSATLREFKTPAPIDIIFRYPIHMRDASGQMATWKVEGEDPFEKGMQKRKEARKAQVKADQEEKIRLVREALMECEEDGVKPTRTNLLERMGEFKGDIVTKTQLRAWTNRKQSPWSPFCTVDVIESDKGISIVKDIVKDINE